MHPRPLMLIDTGIIGGPGRGIIQLATYLANKGMEYRICTFSYSRPKSREFIQELERLNLRTGAISQSFTFDPTAIWQFRRMAMQGRYNILQSHGYKSHLVALVVSRMLGLPWIAFAHGWTQENWKMTLFHSLDSWTLRAADAVVAVSNSLRAHFSEVRGAERPTKLIFNAVDRDAMLGKDGGDVIRNRVFHQTSRTLVGCFGRLSFEKGQDVLLRAVARAVNDGHDLGVLLLGDGPERLALQRLSDELGIKSRVSFHSHSSAIRDYYEAIDLLVLPSRSEGLPNVVLEALSLSLPVVATNVGAVSEVLSDGETGWIVPPDDPEALAQAIVAVFADTDARKRVSAAGNHMVLEKFSPATRGDKILQVYEHVLRERHCE
jgi:glycosyltransferase involved in cell wall biosynthesis